MLLHFKGAKKQYHGGRFSERDVINSIQFHVPNSFHTLHSHLQTFWNDWHVKSLVSWFAWQFYTWPQYHCTLHGNHWAPYNHLLTMVCGGAVWKFKDIQWSLKASSKLTFPSHQNKFHSAKWWHFQALPMPFQAYLWEGTGVNQILKKNLQQNWYLWWRTALFQLFHTVNYVRWCQERTIGALICLNQHAV